MKTYIRQAITSLTVIILLSFTASLTLAGSGSIKGTVIDKTTKEPLPGVNLIVKNTTVGTATNKNGEYVIKKVPIGQLNLVASMMGYKPQKIAINIQPAETKSIHFELESTILEMGAVVVTGTSTPHLVEDMPVRTELIPRKIIEQKNVCNLAEALAFHTGIRVENNCQNCNFSQVRMLGLDGKYSQILIDGDPVVSSLASVYGLEHFPEEMVDQIEVVKGGGSSLYGGGAVAGVINVITRTPMMNQVRIKYQSNSAGGDTDQHLGAVAETVFKEGTSGAYVFGSFRKRNPYDHNSDGFSELGEIRNESIGFKLYHQPLQNSELLASFHQIHEERRGGNKFELPVHEAEIAEWVEHWRSGGTVRWSHEPTINWDYRFFYSFSTENRKSYYGGLAGDTPQDRLDALSFYGKTDNPLHIAGIQSNYRTENHHFTAGMQFSHDKLTDQTASETAYHLDEIYKNTGIFLQDDLHLGDMKQLEFVAGVRFDKHSELSQWIMSPRINGKYELGKGFTLRASYTTGFKPPQTFDEDLHIGGLEGDQRIIRNSTNLHEERSYSISGGAEFLGFINKVPTMISLTTFYTRLTDSFTERFISKQGDIEYWERVNSDGAEVKGIEVDLGVRPVTGFEIRGGLTYKKSKYDSPHEDFESRNFFRTPDLSGNIRLSLSIFDPIDIFFFGNYIGKADLPHEVAIEGQEEPLLLLEKSDHFFQADVGISYSLPSNDGINAKLNFGIKNILNAYQSDLDIGPDRDPGYVYGPIQPRTVYFGIQTAF